MTIEVIQWFVDDAISDFWAFVIREERTLDGAFDYDEEEGEEKKEKDREKLLKKLAEEVKEEFEAAYKTGTLNAFDEVHKRDSDVDAILGGNSARILGL